MARDRRYIDVAVDEAMDVPIALGRLRGVVMRVIEDGVVTPAERGQLTETLSGCERETAECVKALERANVADLVIDAQKRTAGVNAHLRERAAEVGLPIIALSPNLPRKGGRALPDGEAA